MLDEYFEGYLMGVDVGTMGVNAMLFDAHGNPLGGAYREYPSIYPEEHWVEQDAELVISCVFEVLREAVCESGVDVGKIRAVSVASHRASFGLLDRAGKLLNGRFVVWQDNRGVSELNFIREKIDDQELHKLTGMPLAPTYTLSKLVWYKNHLGDFWYSLKRVVFPADYILSRLGGELRTEVTNACCSGMMDIKRLAWSERIFGLFGFWPSHFAPLVNPGTIIGRINEETSKLSGLQEGTLLVTATGDQQCAAIGAGVVDEGMASLTLGTAGLLVMGTRSINLEKCPGLMIPSSGIIGLYELEAIQLGAASCYRWIRDIMALPEKAEGLRQGVSAFVLMEELLQQSQTGSHGLVFLPFLTGAGYPLWDATAQGTFTGLRFSHTRADMIRAVLEGVTIESYDMYQEMRQANVKIKSLAIAGGATASPIWCQTIADTFGLAVKPLKVQNATLVAASIFAGIGAGFYRDVKEGVAQSVRYAEAIKPIPKNTALLQKTHRTYKNLTNTLQQNNIFSQLINLREK
jgi:xylulokinase